MEEFMANTTYNVFNLRFFSIHLKLREKLRDSQKAKEGKPRTIHSQKKTHTFARAELLQTTC